jgi:uncharacterized phiE125 gp8 family phage protein
VPETVEARRFGWYADVLQPWYLDQLAQWHVRVIEAPTQEPVTLAEARLQCRVDPYPVTGDSPTLTAHPDDALLETLISAAREWCEAYTGRALAPQTVEVARSSFPGYYESQPIALPLPPLHYVDSAIYRDDDGIDTSMLADLDYLVDQYGYVPHIQPVIGAVWPTLTNAYPGAVRIRYRTGYAVDALGQTVVVPDVGSPGDSPSATVSVPLVPASVKAAIKLLVGHLYAHRENTTDLRLSEIPLGAQALLRPYRLHLGVA